MPWHVLQGKYLMAYSSDLRPYDLSHDGASAGDHSVIVAMHIDHGLLGAGVDCNGNDVPAGSQDEVHLAVDKVDVVFVGCWSGADQPFSSGTAGRARLHMNLPSPPAPPPAIPTVQQMLQTAFQTQADDAALTAFESIPAAGWKRVGYVPAAGPGTGLAITFGANPADPSTVSLAPSNIGGTPVQGSLSFQPIFNSNLDCTLRNAAPIFRRGLVLPGAVPSGAAAPSDQPADMVGATVAVVTAASPWSDPELGKLSIGGMGEIRDFQWLGGDVPAGSIPILNNALLLANEPFKMFQRALVRFMPKQK